MYHRSGDKPLDPTTLIWGHWGGTQKCATSYLTRSTWFLQVCEVSAGTPAGEQRELKPSVQKQPNTKTFFWDFVDPSTIERGCLPLRL